ncbi:hypothetical protein [Silvimonas sp.]|uniref:hypothetical protein n=1 Tax=Silvimonas sp. TaxID=2650811 RepID=UPI002847BB8C|nr:hypothetical protein [Silvimonas sp.]MDR3429883.1 hypothetical protein [Silvimonas sp.]
MPGGAITGRPTVPLHLGKRKSLRMAWLHGLVDPQHGQRLQQARGSQRTGVNCVKTQVCHQLQHHGLEFLVVPSDKHHGFGLKSVRVGDILYPGLVQGLEHAGTGGACRNLLACRSIKSERELKPVWAHGQWIGAVDHDQAS